MRFPPAGRSGPRHSQPEHLRGSGPAESVGASRQRGAGGEDVVEKERRLVANPRGVGSEGSGHIPLSFDGSESHLRVCLADSDEGRSRNRHVQVLAQSLGDETNLIIPSAAPARAAEGHRDHAGGRPGGGAIHLFQVPRQPFGDVEVGAVLEMGQDSIQRWCVARPRGGREESREATTARAGKTGRQAACAAAAARNRQGSYATVAIVTPGVSGTTAPGASGREEKIEQARSAEGDLSPW